MVLTPYSLAFFMLAARLCRGRNKSKRKVNRKSKKRSFCGEALRQSHRMEQGMEGRGSE
jgi:hypothetical protein